MYICPCKSDNLTLSVQKKVIFYLCNLVNFYETCSPLLYKNLQNKLPMLQNALTQDFGLCCPCHNITTKYFQPFLIILHLFVFFLYFTQNLEF